MANFITNNNESTNLKSRLTELISKSAELKFLVGFFYFSGITELYSALKSKKEDIKIRVLVGLEVDNLISGMVVEYAKNKGEERTKRELENNFIDSVKKSLNDDCFDEEEFYEQIDFFVNLVAENKLIIRRTKKPNHAKLYIFELQDKTIQKNLFITGSSNLTKAGLSHQNEFNVEIKDYGTKEASEYFEKLWENSVLITENEILKDRLLKTIQNKTPIRKITPFEAFVIILKTYLDSRIGKNIDSASVKEIIKDAGYKPYKYQEDAVQQATGILDKYNGVIIADVVGLGKSVIASTVAKVNNQRGIILCPPGLESAWKQYKEEFKLYSWEVLSSGNMEKTTEFVKQAQGSIKTIIIDEVHKFRNSDTANYEKLKNICREKKVILLTATPFNNSPADILSLLSLFVAPKKTTLILDGNLKNLFKKYGNEFTKLSEIKKYYNHSNPEKRKLAEENYQRLFDEEKLDIKKVQQKSKRLATQIRSVIEPVTVRRNRLDLQKHPDYKAEVQNLSDVEIAPEWFYELTKKQSEFYDTILQNYFGEEGKFRGAIYNPFIYESGKTEDEKLNLEENRQLHTQKNTTVFMKRLLVKRLESSFGSFEKSIENQISTTETILEFIGKNQKYILDRKLLEKITEYDEDEVEKALIDFRKKLEENNFPKNNKIYDLNKNFKDKDKFVADINSDLEMYKKIKKELLLLDMVKNDPKSFFIIKKIKEVLKKTSNKGEPQRKIIIFTEYRDTANFLFKILKKEFGDKILFSGDLGARKIKEINDNFDAGLSKDKQKNDYEILLATDKISEGFNLNRAGLVINYDIPWNPVRVVQRVGRINRISKKVFEKLFIVNFFPTEKGAELVQIEKIASNKMFMIHNILGEDSKIFHLDEKPSPAALFEKLRQDPDEEAENFETKIVNQFRAIKEQYPELIKKIENYPSKLKVAKTYQEKSLVVFTKRQQLYIQKTVKDERNKIFTQGIPLEEIYNEIYCDDPKLKSLPLSANFWEMYTKTKEFKERIFATGSQLSIEVRTTNLLNEIINDTDGDVKLKEMAEILLEDINDYGTIALPTMRRIVKLKTENSPEKRLSEFKDIITDLGGIHYLEKIKEKIKDTKKEIIIAIENQ